MITQEKQFRTTLILGRFQPLHIGHQYLINTALSISDSVLILIGSSQEESTNKNPFSYSLRKEMLQRVYGDRIKIAPLKDLGLGDVTGWGDYLLSEARKIAPDLDCFLFGEEKKCERWFSKEVKESITFYKVTRNKIKVNATKLRELLREGNIEEVKTMMDSKLTPLIPKLIEITKEATSS